MRNDRVNKALVALLIAAPLLIQVGDTQAQSYPRRAIQLHVAHDADSNAGNRIAHAMQQVLAAKLNTAVTVSTPKDRAGKLASELVGSSAGVGGYHLMLANADSHLAPSDDTAKKTLAPLPLLGVVVSTPMICVVNAQASINTMADLVTRLSRDPKLRMSSAGKSSHSHLTAQLVLRAAGVKTRMNHLSLKSPAAALAAVLKGTAQFTCVSAPLCVQLLKRRQLKALVVTSSFTGIDAPTAKELGYQGFEVLDNFAAFAASGRVKPVVIDTWQRVITQLSQDNSFTAQAKQLGFRVGKAQLMLRAQANAELATKRAVLRDLLDRYGVNLAGR